MSTVKEAAPYIDSNGTLHFSLWYSNGGGMSFNRDCLGRKDPEQTYNYLKRHGITPEHYGIFAFDHPEIRNLSKLELVELCIAQQDQIDGMLKTGMF